MSFGSWFLVLGSWFLVLGSWCLVLGLVAGLPQRAQGSQRGIAEGDLGDKNDRPKEKVVKLAKKI